MLTQAGHPCRSSLAIYQQIDLLSAYIVPVNLSTSSSSLFLLIAKVVTVSVLDKHYCVVQPNNIERHYLCFVVIIDNMPDRYIYVTGLNTTVSYFQSVTFFSSCNDVLRGEGEGEGGGGWQKWWP